MDTSTVQDPKEDLVDAIDRRYPGVDWYDNNGMYPDCRRQSGVKSCNVFVHDLRSSAMRNDFVNCASTNYLKTDGRKLMRLCVGQQLISA